MKPFHPTMKRNWFVAIDWRKQVSSNKFLSKKSFRRLFKVEVYQQLGDFSLGRFFCPLTGTSPPTGSSPNWQFPQLALFAKFVCVIENWSPPTAGQPKFDYSAMVEKILWELPDDTKGLKRILIKLCSVF